MFPASHANQMSTGAAVVSRRAVLRLLLRGTVIAAAHPLLVACQPSQGSARPTTVSTPTASLSAVHVGSSARTLAGVGMYLAAERGYFAGQGLDVTLSEVSANDAFPALGSGRVDAISVAVGPALFNAAARGIPLKVVAPMVRQDPGASSSFFMVRQDLFENGEFTRGFADLAGKKIALGSADTLGPYTLSHALRNGGVNTDSVDTVLLDFPEITTAFANRAIDIAIQPEPTASASVARGVAVKWREIADVVPGLQNTVVVFGPDLVTQRKEVGIRWVTAYLKGVRDYHAAILKRGSDRPEVVSILTRWTPVTDPRVYDAMGFPFIDPNGEVNRESLADELRFFRDQGQLTGQVEVGDILDTHLAAAAVQQLGRYQS